MGVKQNKPCGAFADVKELEYVSALHQTGKKDVRRDGSIQSIDIVHYLMSRHGIKVAEDEVSERIMGAFGDCSKRREEYGRQGRIPGASPLFESAVENGNDAGEEDSGENSEGGEEDCLDLTQVLALLLVPLLLKAERSLSSLHPVFGSSASSNEETGGESKTTNVTPLLTEVRRNASGWPSTFAMHRHRERGNKRWPDADLIQNVLGVIMYDATGDPNPRPLTKELLRQILNFYGEEEMADDDRLLDEMMAAAGAFDSADAASDDDAGLSVLFDQHAFARALTHDVQQYGIEFEDQVTTNYFDIFGVQEGEKKKIFPRLTNNAKTAEASGVRVEGGRPVQTAFTFPTIDYTADTFQSKVFAVLLWVTWILSYSSYLTSNDVLSFAHLKCDPNHFGCTLLQGITNWIIIMLQLSILGTTFIIWASMGNVYPTRPVWIVLGMGAVVLFVVVPYFEDFNAVVISTEKSGEIDQQLLYHLSVICGFILLAYSLLNLFQSILPARLSEFADKLLTPGIRIEAKIKQAASFKVNQLVRNACEVHKTTELDGGISNGVGETKYGKAMITFAKSSDLREDLGGFLQTWKRIWSGQLFEEDGILFTTHMLAGNVAQVTICLLLGTIFISFYGSDLFQQGLGHLQMLIQGSQRWRLMIPLYFGFFCGEITILTIIAKYIPSTVNTILQFRSGGYESLHNKKFLKLRFAVDQSSLLFGSMFWGTLYTSVIIGFFALLVMGVVLWPDFAQLVAVFFANIIGIGITVLLKWVVLIGFRRRYQKGYYRRSVGLTNFIRVVLESWNLGLTSSYMLFRSLKLLIAATLFIGRIDIPFLSEEACFLGPFELDAYPLIFRKDILEHEAHRHPYLERLGVMYMLKLRFDNFGNYAGTCWRLLFVYALLPWMRKYRNSYDGLNIAGFKFAANRTWTGRMPTELLLNEKSNALNFSGEGAISNQSDSEETGDSITALKRQNVVLKKENEMMRSLLFHNQNTSLAMSCPPNIFTNSLSVGHDESTRTL